jgi:hypothetical protein
LTINLHIPENSQGVKKQTNKSSTKKEVILQLKKRKETYLQELENSPVLFVVRNLDGSMDHKD